METYLIREEVAELLRTTPATLAYWARMNRGPRSVRVGKRVLYPVSGVEEFLAAAADDQVSA